MPTLRDTIIPKSDQLNYDDVLSGSLTATVRDVRITSADQPLLIYLDGIDRPYKPCKSMRRILITCWGDEEKKWIGQSLTLYGDEKVKWAGQGVGGIRISHVTGIQNTLSVAMTISKGKREPYVVYPLTLENTRPEPTLAERCKEWLRAKGIAESDAIAYIGKPLEQATDEDFARIGKMKPIVSGDLLGEDN